MGRRSSMRMVLAAVLAFLIPGSVAAQARPTDEADVKTLVSTYVDAREKRDATALAALFVSDADQLVSSGEWRRGKEAVVAGGLASSARSSGVRTIEVEHVRFASPDVAIADGRYEVGGTGGAEGRRMWTTFVMVRVADGWRISAIRNMLPAAP